MPTRREFLSQTLVAGSSVAISASQLGVARKGTSAVVKRLRVLILGGTGFIGPHFVRAAVERGHKVSVFNRGKSQADLPQKVERLAGDRVSDLRSIENRDWDAVIDLAAYVPEWVRTLGQALKNRVRHYTYISTVDVYKNIGADPKGTDEASETKEFDGVGDPYSADGGGGTYGPLKVICEREAQTQFPGKALIVRPGYMVGPGDPQERFTYWVARMEKGGEILAPGDPLQPVQFIDVRDVAEWIIRMAESEDTGVFNALGPGLFMSMSMSEMLGAIRGIFSIPMKLIWVSIPWIADQKIVDQEALEWSIWRFCRETAINSDQACAKGLTYRPLSITAHDTFAWYKTLPLARQEGVQTGAKKDAAGNWLEVITPLSAIMERERKIIARWRLHQSRLT